MLRSFLAKYAGDGRTKRKEVQQVRENLKFLIDNKDSEGFRKYLIALGLEEGSPEFAEAIQAWKEFLRENQ